MAPIASFTDTDVKSTPILVFTGPYKITGYFVENNGLQDAWLKFYIPTYNTGDPDPITATGSTPVFQLKILARDSKELSNGLFIDTDPIGIFYSPSSLTMRAVTSPDDSGNDSPDVGLIVRLALKDYIP